MIIFSLFITSYESLKTFSCKVALPDPTLICVCLEYCSKLKMIKLKISQFLAILQVISIVPTCCKFYNFPICATLKSNSDTFTIPNLYKIPDFSLDYFPNKNPISFFANNISLEISPGCQLSLFDQTYFQGNKTDGNNITIANSGVCSCQEVNF